MKKKTKRLALNRETLMALAGYELETAQGANHTVRHCTITCATDCTACTTCCR